MKHKAADADWWRQVEWDEHPPPHPSLPSLCNDRAMQHHLQVSVVRMAIFWPRKILSKTSGKNISRRSLTYQPHCTKSCQKIVHVLSEDDDFLDIDTGPFTVSGGSSLQNRHIFLCILGKQRHKQGKCKAQVMRDGISAKKLRPVHIPSSLFALLKVWETPEKRTKWALNKM